MSDLDKPTATETLGVDTPTAAAVIGSTAGTLEKDRATGHLGVPFVRAGRRVIYRLADLDAWLRANRVFPRKADETGTFVMAKESAEIRLGCAAEAGSITDGDAE